MTAERANSALLRELGYLTEHDIADIAGTTLSTVQHWRTERRGPPFTKLGRRPLYRIEAVQKWLREQEQETQP